MKTLLIVLAAALIFATGCSQQHLAPDDCRSCRVGLRSCPPDGGPASVGRLPHSYFDATQGPLGPPSPTYAYPYYTTRAPRDFLEDNPPTIGL